MNIMTPSFGTVMSGTDTVILQIPNTGASYSGCLLTLRDRAGNIGNRVALPDFTSAFSRYAACNLSGLNIPVIECEALMDLYTNTAGSGWSVSTNWGTNPDVETWQGVDLVAGHVDAIQMAGNNLSGSLPSFRNLPELRWFSAWGNPTLVGNIPNLSENKKLEELYLYNSNLDGIIEGWSGATALRIVSIQNNQLYGNFPELPASINYVQAQSNQLDGIIEPLWNATGLIILYLSNNYLSVLIFCDTLLIDDKFLPACFSAGESFTPSPVMAVTLPASIPLSVSLPFFSS